LNMVLRSEYAAFFALPSVAARSTPNHGREIGARWNFARAPPSPPSKQLGARNEDDPTFGTRRVRVVQPRRLQLGEPGALARRECSRAGIGVAQEPDWISVGVL